MTESKQKITAKSKLGIHNLIDADEESEHELFYYAGNRIELMKEVLKLIKPKKIKSAAPDFMKNLDIEEINSMLLEELLGISNKRLKRILNGENVDEETSSSESEEEKPIDVISLDDISDSEDDFGSDSVNTTKNDHKNKKHKSRKTQKLIKEEKPSNSVSDKVTNESENEKLMSVLEILELQARARAIRSQLALENINKKQGEQVASVNVKEENSEDSDAIVVDSPKNEEIVITSSDSENEGIRSSEFQGTENAELISHNKYVELQQTTNTNGNCPVIILEDDQSISKSSEQENEKQQSSSEKVTTNSEMKDTILNLKADDKILKNSSLHEKSDSENEDVINLDIEEMENV